MTPRVVHVKICGVTSAGEAVACAELGASAIGVNLIASSKRVVTRDVARDIVRAVGTRALVVGVVEGMSVSAMRALAEETGVGCLQLHGDEPPEAVSALLPHAYKAVRIANADDVSRAATFPGGHVLVDAKVSGALGGTGATFDWTLVVALAKARKLTLAGGLTPENVADAVRVVRPYCVDVASGVERPGNPREKDLDRVRSFLESAGAATT